MAIDAVGSASTIPMAVSSSAPGTPAASAAASCAGPVPSGGDGDDGAAADRSLEPGRGVEGEQPAVVDDRDPVGEGVGLGHVVGDEQDCLPGGLQSGDDVVDGQAALGVQAGGELVEEQHFRLVHDGPADHQPLRHPAGQLVNPLAGGVCQAHLIEQPGGGAGPGSGGPHLKCRPWKMRLSRTFRRRSRGCAGGTTPMCWCTRAGAPATSIPATQARPEVGRAWVARIPAVVDLATT